MKIEEEEKTKFQICIKTINKVKQLKKHIITKHKNINNSDFLLGPREERQSCLLGDPSDSIFFYLNVLLLKYIYLSIYAE